MASLKRPRPVAEEDEDDLLLLQSQFLQSHACSSAQVVKQQQLSSSSKKQDRKADQAVKVTPQVPMSLNIQIIERDVSGVTSAPAPSIGVRAFPEAVSRHTVLSAGQATATSTGGRHSGKQSIFARQFGLPNKTIVPDPVADRCVIDGSGLGPGGPKEVDQIQAENVRLLQSLTTDELEIMKKDMFASIKPESLEFLKRKSMHTSTSSAGASTSGCVVTGGTMLMDVEMQGDEVPDPNPTVHSLPEVTSQLVKDFSNCQHMDRIEVEKLKWMTTPIPEAEGTKKQNTSVIHCEARFNFQGELMLDPGSGILSPESESDSPESTTRQGLHHHGSDQERPGYTLNELLMLIDSSLSAQKIIGLHVIGNIVCRAYRGEYDSVFNACLADQLLRDSSILLMVRRCLDDTNQTVTTAAITCLRNLLCNTDIDELYLDRVFVWNLGSFQVPSLDPESLVHIEKVAELKDDEMIRLDAVRGLLLRSDLLPRLRYLMDHLIRHQDDPIIVRNLFAILIRIARHSADACRQMFDTPFLMETILKHFVRPLISLRPDSFYGNPFSQALKLIRILSASSSQVAEEMIHKFPDLLNSCRVYMTIDPSTCGNAEQERQQQSSDRRPKCPPVDLFKLSLESLRFHCVCLRHESMTASAAAFDSLHQVFPILIRQSQYLLTMSPLLGCVSNQDDWKAAASGETDEEMGNTSSLFDWHFASTLISCIESVATAAGVSPRSVGEEERMKFVLAFKGMIESALLKWVTLLLNQVVLPDSLDICLTIWTAVRFLLHVDADQAKGILMRTERDKSSSSLHKLHHYLLMPLVMEHKSGSSLWSKVISNLTDTSSIALAINSIQMKRRKGGGEGTGNQLNDCENSKAVLEVREGKRSSGIHPDFGSTQRHHYHIDTSTAYPRSGSLTSKTTRTGAVDSILANDSCLPLLQAVLQISLACLTSDQQVQDKQSTSAAAAAAVKSANQTSPNEPEDMPSDMQECIAKLILTKSLVNFVTRSNQSLMTMMRRERKKNEENSCSFFLSYEVTVLSHLALLSARLIPGLRFIPKVSCSSTPPSSPVPFSQRMHEAAHDSGKEEEEEESIFRAKTSVARTQQVSSASHHHHRLSPADAASLISLDHRSNVMTGEDTDESPLLPSNLLIKLMIEKEKVAHNFLQLSLSLLTLIPDPLLKQQIRTSIIFDPALYAILMQSNGSLEEKVNARLRIREEFTESEQKMDAKQSLTSTGQSGDLMQQQQTDSQNVLQKVDHGISVQSLQGKLVQVAAIYSKYSSCGSCYWFFDPITSLMMKVRMRGSADLNPMKDDDLESAEMATAGMGEAVAASAEVTASNAVPKSSLNPVECCLSFVRLLAQVMPEFLFPDHDDDRIRNSFMLITCTFLTSGDHFLDPAVRSHLYFFLDHYLSLGSRFRLYADDPIPDHIFARSSNNNNNITMTGIAASETTAATKPTVADLFDLLIAEYESSSYSDPLFTSFLLMFLRSTAPSASLSGSGESSTRAKRPVDDDQEKSNTRLKLRFFSEENSSCLQSMNTTCGSFDQRLVDQLMSQQETDLKVIEAYVKSLLSLSIRKDRNQLLYMLCTHHINQSLYLNSLHRSFDFHSTIPASKRNPASGSSSEENELLILKLRRSIDLCRNESLKRDLLNYQAVQERESE